MTFLNMLCLEGICIELYFHMTCCFVNFYADFLRYKAKAGLDIKFYRDVYMLISVQRMVSWAFLNILEHNKCKIGIFLNKFLELDST